MTLKWLGLALSVIGSAYAQTGPPGRPQFEVASIKPAPLQPADSVSTRISIDEARINFTNVTIKDMLGEAYKVPQSQISGPDSAGSRRFNVIAKIPAGVAEKQVPQMLQSLLDDRFKLAFHRETMMLSVYALTVGKNGPKVKPTESATGISSNSNRNGTHVRAKISIPSLAEFLALKLGRPVLDMTGLSGVFDITVDWAPEPVGQEAASDSAAGPSVFTALQERLGLKLESTRGAVEFLVIDHVERPSDN